MKNKYTRFTLRITEEQDKELSVLADKLDLKKAEVIRHLIDINLKNIEKEIETKKELNENIKKLAFQIKKIGTVLNQNNRNFFDNKNFKIDEINKGIDELWQYLKVLKE